MILSQPVTHMCQAFLRRNSLSASEEVWIFCSLARLVPGFLLIASHMTLPLTVSTTMPSGCLECLCTRYYALP